MKRIFITGIFILFLLNNAMAQSLQRLYNFCPDTALASSNSAQYADDSFFIAGGQAPTQGGTQLSTYLAVFDYKLNLLRKKYLYFPGIYNRLWGGDNAIIKTGYDRYALVGYEDAIDTNTRVKEIDRPYLYIFNSNLDSLGFSKEDDTLINKWPYSLMRDKEGNILVSGLITSTSLHYNTWEAGWDPDSSYVWVAKYDSNANLIWSRQYFGHDESDNIGYKMILSHDSESYILTGICENTVNKDWENFFAKLDTAGNVIWQSFLPKKYLSERDIDITALHNDGYGFVTSYSDTAPLLYRGVYSILRSDYYYGKFNDTGNILWTKCYCGDSLYQKGEKITEAPNGDLILLGTSYWDYTFPSMYRTDSTGKIKMRRQYFYKDYFAVDNQLGFVSVAPNNQLLLSGAVGSQVAHPGIFDSSGSLSWFVLTDTFDCINGGCETGDSVWNDTTNAVQNVNNIGGIINVYPNPLQEQLYIQTKDLPQGCEAALMDISGRRLYEVKLKANTKEAIDVGKLTAGLYLLQVWENGMCVKTYKVSKE